jgi:hypothetical protein
MPRSEYAISHHENDIPVFVGHELNRLYGGRYASLAHFKIYGNAKGAHTYVARKEGEATEVFLFKRRKQNAFVLNEGIKISREEAARFADYLFSIDKLTAAVNFNCVETDARDFAYPYLRVPCEEDIVLALPDTVERYLNSLGKATRSNLRTRLNKLKRDFPSFQFSVYEKEEADERHIREIIRLSRLRVTNKNKISIIDAEEEERIIRCVRECGFVCVATIDGRLCCGAVNFRLGRNFSARILANDPIYDNYRLGFACAFLTICECIKVQGSERFYFGWGENEYKVHLGGKPRQLSRLIIYRSWRHVLLNAGQALNTLLGSSLFRARHWILQTAKLEGNGIISVATGNLVKGVRRLKAVKADLLKKLGLPRGLKSS